MTPFPLNLTELLGHWNAYIVFLVIGFAFGAVLEMSGFGNSKKLAAQFYFKEMTVLKVMFTGIVVAMLLVFLATAIGLLDYNLIWVNPTYWIPGILGGLIMGVGFIIGGFCPGTSIVSAATGKIDGMFFLAGVFFGIFFFGETVSGFEDLWYSTYEGRLSIPEWLGVDTGVVVLGIVIMALFAFFGAELAEKYIGGMDLSQAPKWRFGAAGGAVMLGAVVLLIGQPTHEDRWEQMAEEKTDILEARGVQIHPAELLAYIHNDRVNTVMLDVRHEADYNYFHILDARHVGYDTLFEEVPNLISQPSNTLFVLMSNDEALATEAWKLLVAESVPNVYILEGGINNWVATYGRSELEEIAYVENAEPDTLRYDFPLALGARYGMASPRPDAFILDYAPKVELKVKRAAGSGGCG